MRLFLLTTTFLILFSCSQSKNKFNYESSIASITYEAESDYLDNRLSFYQRLSEKGNYYWKESKTLTSITSIFKEKVRKGEQINTAQQKGFYKHFEATFQQSPYVDFEKYGQLQELPLKTVSDIDLVKRYIKSCFLYILNDNKLLPFDSYGPLACAEKQTINNGEPFVYRLSMNAFNSRQPFEWYIVKDSGKPLSNDNIIDTLRADESGAVYGEVKNYKKGENTVFIVSRLGMTEGDKTISTSIKFFVK